LRKADEKKETREQKSGAPLSGAGSAGDADVSAEGRVMVCQMDEDALKNSRMREIVKPLKAVINTLVPLVPVPRLADARNRLHLEFPYALDAIDVALADLVGRTTVRLQPILFLGPPGGGKSRFCRRLGELLGVQVWRCDASQSDGATFGGTDRRWNSAEACHPFLAIARAKIANPIVLLDEIEKAATRCDCGRLWDNLLGFLEPETSERYPDPALQTPLNLSQVTYVATANSLRSLPAPVRDRFRIVAFPKPRLEDLEALLPQVIADLVAERGLDARWVEPLSGAERNVVAMNWRGESVRLLRRILDVVLRVRETIAAE
jgi:ATP-dependent Lon protease